MRWRAGAVAALAAVLWAGAAGSAAADGAAPLVDPDVAVIVWTGTGRTASWHAGERDFDRLRSLLDPSYSGTEPVPEEWTRDRRPPVRFTVLWGLTGVGGWPQTQRAPGGDVAMLRQDQLFLAEDGTPWVRSDPAPDVADDDIRWHRVPRDTYAWLAEEGFFAPDGAADTREDGGPDGVWWAAAGLGAGVAGTLLVRRAADRYRTGPPRGGPRQELIDL
ncbi:hypothetical protein [Streptomyces sp. enrichment culture]|uniref:hypothetical protein n=1 Tax=Streptomyces sp. enrichment culture TaxID=1795815 RepID=UPI003F562D82